MGARKQEAKPRSSNVNGRFMPPAPPTREEFSGYRGTAKFNSSYRKWQSQYEQEYQAWRNANPMVSAMQDALRGATREGIEARVSSFDQGTIIPIWRSSSNNDFARQNSIWAATDGLKQALDQAIEVRAIDATVPNGHLKIPKREHETVDAVIGTIQLALYASLNPQFDGDLRAFKPAITLTRSNDRVYSITTYHQEEDGKRVATFNFRPGVDIDLATQAIRAKYKAKRNAAKNLLPDLRIDDLIHGTMAAARQDASKNANNKTTDETPPAFSRDFQQDLDTQALLIGALQKLITSGKYTAQQLDAIEQSLGGQTIMSRVVDNQTPSASNGHSEISALGKRSNLRRKHQITTFGEILAEASRENVTSSPQNMSGANLPPLNQGKELPAGQDFISRNREKLITSGAYTAQQLDALQRGISIAEPGNPDVDNAIAKLVATVNSLSDTQMETLLEDIYAVEPRLRPEPVKQVATENAGTLGRILHLNSLRNGSFLVKEEAAEVSQLKEGGTGYIEVAGGKRMDFVKMNPSFMNPSLLNYIGSALGLEHVQKLTQAFGIHTEDLPLIDNTRKRRRGREDESVRDNRGLYSGLPVETEAEKSAMHTFTTKKGDRVETIEVFQDGVGRYAIKKTVKTKTGEGSTETGALGFEEMTQALANSSANPKDAHQFIEALKLLGLGQPAKVS